MREQFADDGGDAAEEVRPETVFQPRDGRSLLEVPLYSHERYDVLADPERIDRPDVLVVEGVVALQRPFADLGIYVHADEADVIAWYVARFQGLVRAAGDDPTSFYRGWVDLDDAAVADLARAVWDGVNRPNLYEHIAPTRAAEEAEARGGWEHKDVLKQREKEARAQAKASGGEGEG